MQPASIVLNIAVALPCLQNVEHSKPGYSISLWMETSLGLAVAGYHRGALCANPRVLLDREVKGHA